jgi:branched-chain amino acid transport system permease protein
MFDRYLPANPRLRLLVGYVALVVATLFSTQILMPALGGRDVPAAILFKGLVSGVLFALSGAGIVLVYRTLRVINFAQGLIGLPGLIFLVYMEAYTNVPFLVNFLLAVAISLGLGAIFGVAVLRFFRSSRLFLTVVTIVGASAVSGVITFINRLPFFPPQNRRSPSDIPDIAKLQRLLPFAGFHFRVGSFALHFGFSEVFALEVAALAVVTLGIFFRYTKAGVAVRAVAENPERASLLGISTGALSVVVWTLAGGLSGITLVLSYVSIGGAAAGGGGNAGTQTGFALLLPIFAAAVLARFRDLDKVVAYSIALGIAQQAWQFSHKDTPSFFDLILFVIVCGGLLIQRRGYSRADAGTDTSWSATEEPRPVPHELSRLAPIRITRVVLSLLVLGFVALYPFVASTKRVVLAQDILIYAIAVLSLVVLTGWAGQVSLGQYGLSAVAAVVSGALAQRVGITFWLAVPIGMVVAAGVAVLVGLPALRIKGLFLMVTTFGFAVAVRSVLFDTRYFGWLLPSTLKPVNRPTLFFFNFEDEKSMYFLCLAAVVLSIVVVRNLRRSRVGRILIALRENEANVQSFGVSALRMKLLAFAISGALAGLGGALAAFQARAVAADSFSADRSVFAFVAAVIGGVSSPTGALLGAAYFVLTQNLLTSNAVLLAFLQSGGPVLILFVAPGGFISLINQVRDSVLRIIAQRRQIVVPSLFADYDPDALERRLVPLADPDLQSGLAAVPPDRRFTMASELYAGSGTRITELLGPQREADDVTALSAAARSALEAEYDADGNGAGDGAERPLAPATQTGEGR